MLIPRLGPPRSRPSLGSMRSHDKTLDSDEEKCAVINLARLHADARWHLGTRLFPLPSGAVRLLLKLGLRDPVPVLASPPSAHSAWSSTCGLASGRRAGGPLSVQLALEAPI